jgi:ABC-type transport system substrate-binding protein
LLAQIRVTLDEKERVALYQALQRTLLDNPLFLYRYELETFEAVQRRVQNYQPRPTEGSYFKAIFLRNDP